MADNPDLALGVEFYTKAVEIPRLSKKEGRPIYEDREFIRIRFPADQKRELSAPAHEMHYVPHLRKQVTYAQRFADVYRAFCDGQADFVSGTPLDILPFLSNARREEFRAKGVRTVEQLAGLPDASARQLGFGAMDLREQAKVFLDASKGVAETSAMQDEIAKLKAEIAAMGSVPAEVAAEDPPEAVDTSGFDGFGDDELRAMYQDATGKAADGRWKADRIKVELAKIHAKAAA